MTDISEFDHLFRTHYEPLFHFARQFVSDEEECHDIVSAAFESVWDSRATIESDKVRYLLYTVVKNKAIDYLRKAVRHRSYLQYVSAMGDYMTSPERLGEHDDEQRIIRRVLDELGSPTGDILRACYIEEKKYREVAEEMNISIATVKKHIVKALKHIREVKKTLKT